MRLKLFATLVVATCTAGSLPAQPVSDEWQRTPVDDRTFQGFLQFFAYDRALPFDVRSQDAEAVEGVEREHLSYQSTPGQRVTAMIYRATASAGGGRRWIVLLHGGAAPGKDGRAIQLAATFFARAGWNVLTPDLLHYGERKTELVPVIMTSELVARLYSNPPVYLDWVAQTVKDAGRALDFLVNERGADPNRVVLVGFSRGAVVGTIIGAADPRFRAVALLYAGHYLAIETRAHLPAACPANYIGRISPRPLFMVNGTQDNLFLRESSVLPLQRLAREPKTVVWQETGHMGLFREDLPRIVGWLREQVPEGGEP